MLNAINLSPRMGSNVGNAQPRERNPQPVNCKQTFSNRLVGRPNQQIVHRGTIFIVQRIK